MKKIVMLLAVAAAIAFVAIQFVPAARSNPASKNEPRWDSPETRAFAARACFDCHSNETKWPWYSRIAPVSWAIAGHVREGREELNFSEWPSGDLEEAAEAVEKEKMPLVEYLLLHPEARLSSDERTRFAAGLRATEAAALAPAPDTAAEHADLRSHREE